jgi:hypothetical protein
MPEGDLRVNIYKVDRLAKVIGADKMTQYIPPERWRERYLEIMEGGGERVPGGGEREKEECRRHRNHGEMVR